VAADIVGGAEINWHIASLDNDATPLHGLENGGQRPSKNAALTYVSA